MPEDKPARRKRPTIADVAKRAGVAPAIVSRALSPERRPVSREKRERVLKAAAELGYNQNPLARGLATNSLDMVAVIVNHITDLSDLDLFDPLLEAIQALGKQAVIIRVGNTEKIEDFLRNSAAFHVHAALVFSDFADAEGVRTLFHSDNVLMLNGRFDAKSAYITIDEAAGIREAVTRALERGAKTGALVTGRQTSLIEQARIQAYRDICAGAGLDLVQELQGDYSYASGLALAGRIDGASLPDAIFCTSDAMAMGMMDGLRARDLLPPRDYRLYGFDAVVNANFNAFDISSIGFDKAELIHGISMFLKDPTGYRNHPEVHELHTRFVERSTG